MLVDEPRSPELMDLTPTEERLIALYSPCVVLFAVQGIGRFTRGNVVFYERDVLNTACTLPRKVDDAGVVYIRDATSSGEIWESRIRPDRVFKALEFLFNTNGRYWQYILSNTKGMESYNEENMTALRTQAEKAGTVDENGELYFVIDSRVLEDDDATSSDDPNNEDKDEDYQPEEEDDSDDDDDSWSSVDSNEDEMRRELEELEEDAALPVEQRPKFITLTPILVQNDSPTPNIKKVLQTTFRIKRHHRFIRCFDAPTSACSTIGTTASPSGKRLIS